MPRANDGKVADNGVFILNDWGAIETLSGTFAAFGPDGKRIVSRKFKANLFNNGLSPDGRLAVCQTANAPSDDGGKLTVFDLVAGTEISQWQAESGWASFYEFPDDGQTIRLGYRDRGAFAYGLDGTFIERAKWLALGLQKGDLQIVGTLLSESNNQPDRALVDLLLPAIDIALATIRESEVKWRAQAFRLRGVCFEAVADSARALECYEKALSLDPKVGVKRKAVQLRKAIQ
jgi:tetratricopeptide (TPR) repeat protein